MCFIGMTRRSTRQRAADRASGAASPAARDEHRAIAEGGG